MDTHTWLVRMQRSQGFEPFDMLKFGRYLYWDGNAQLSFELVRQESQSQVLLSKVVNAKASSGILKKTEDPEETWEASVTAVTGTSLRWKLQPAAEDAEALVVERSDGFKGQAQRMRESKQWQAVVSQPVDSGQTLLINAAPGSGKSILLREWCRGRPNNEILLMAFNRVVKDQLEVNFKSELPNVEVRTVHSLAFDATRHLHHGYVGEPTKTDIKNFLKCSWPEVERQQELLRLFCASASSRLIGHHGRELQLHNSLWRHFASGNCSFRVPHNVYLKLLQLNPELRDQTFEDFDIVVLDEAQDCTACMLDLLNGNKFARVFACDPYQNIYRFNHVDGRYLADMQVEYRMSLPQSFRFGPQVAQLLTRIARASPMPANSVLEVQGLPELQTSVEVTESPSESILRLVAEKQKVTVLARKNSTLFFQAVDMIASLQDGKSVCFIGGFDVFRTAQLDPVMDLFHLQRGQKDEVKSNYVNKFDSLGSFRSKCERDVDVEWLTKFNIYDKFSAERKGREKLQDLIKGLEDKTDLSSQLADVVFSTVHQAKGLGFRNVVLLEDFLDEFSMEECNIFYVACSRVSTGTLFVPRSVMQTLELGGHRGRKRSYEPSSFDFFDGDFDDLPEDFEDYSLEQEDDEEDDSYPYDDDY